MKKFRILGAMLLMVVLTVSTSTVAFASGGEYEEPVTVIEPVEPPKPPTPLTPEGNLTLVDDIEATDEIDKQFITAVSKNGNYFYLVIDRAGKTDNVYLLNMVDEADLMALMEDETVTTEPTPEVEVIPEVEPIPEEEPKKNSTLLLLILVLAMCGGGAFYYLKFVKTKSSNKGNSDFEDFEDEDDDYDIEETFNEENMESVANDDDDNYHDSDDTELV